MDDLISRQDAIEAIAKFVPYAICDESTESYTNGLTDAYNLICQLPSEQPEQRWIPWSSGKLPEESGTYTVTAYDGATKRVTYAKYQKRLKRWELTGARAYWRVLAWMPLPPAYHADEESNA